MNIQFIKSNISNTSQNGLVKLLYDLILQDIRDVNNYKDGWVYTKGDRVYLEENGKHQIYQCIANISSNNFIRSEWMHIMEAFRGVLDKVYNLKLHEEVHIINAETTKSIITNLDFDISKSVVTIYNGKKRFVYEHDFFIEEKTVIFNNPFNIGDRLILEVRERVGIPASLGIVFYNLSGVPYKVVIAESGIISCQKVESKSPADQKYTELVTGDCTYTMMIDSSVNPPTLGLYKNIETHITGTDGNIYKLDIVDETINMIPSPSSTSDVNIVLGSDKKFYTLGINDNVVTATLVNDESLIPSKFDLGLKVITNEFEQKMIDIRNGEIRLVDYISNAGYHNIVFKSKGDNKLIYLSINDNLELEVTDDSSLISGTRSQELEYFYFYDENWNYHKLYFENSNLYYEPCDEVVIPDSKGINLITPSGEIAKVFLNNTSSDFSINKVINVLKNGTFESPIEGFVMMVDGVKKIITVNRTCDGFDIIDTNNKFRTNHHYLRSEDDKVYKLLVENNKVKLTECDSSEYEIRNIPKGTFIKSNEIITKIDIKNSSPVFNPISTFTHRIKSDDGKSYILDIEGGQNNEVLKFKEISGTDFNISTGIGDLYLQDSNGSHYTANLVSGNLELHKAEKMKGVDYEITSLVYSSLGWYKLSLNNGVIKINKIFDNLYENRMSYGNIVKKDFILTSENKTDYSLFADGNGELSVEKIKPMNVKGLVLRSDNGFVYGLGVKDSSLVTYESYISNPRVPNKLYITDSVTGKIYSVSMIDDRLYTELESSNVPSKNRYSIYDIYQKEYSLVMINGQLVIQVTTVGIIDAIVSISDDNYTVNILDDGNNMELVLDDTTVFNNPGMITVKDSITNISYRGYINADTIELEETDIDYPTEQLVTTNDGVYNIKLENGWLYFNKLEGVGEDILKLVDNVFKTTRININPNNIIVSMGGVDEIPYIEEKIDLMNMDDIDNIMSGLT